MSCAAVVESFVAFLDGEIDAGERRTIEQHVAECSSCAGELEQLRVTRALVSRQLARAGAGRSAGSFDELWHRLETDQRPLRVVAGGTPRRSARRRLAVWMGTGGLALAAGLALMVVGLQPAGSPPSPARVAQPAPGGQVKEAQRAAPRVAAQAHAKQGAELAKRAPAQNGDDGDATADHQVAEVANEIDPPAELLERPDLFLNYPVMRKLDELQHLESVLAEPGDEGGAG